MAFKIIRESVSVDGRAAKAIYAVTEELYQNKTRLKRYKDEKRPRAIAELRAQIAEELF